MRSFQARNNMMEMELGDLALFYHSSIAQPAAVGICRVVRTAYPDFTQFDRDERILRRTRRKPDKPIWFMVDVAYVERFANPVTLARCAPSRAWSACRCLRRGQRLSVQPVMPHEWKIVLELATRAPGKASRAPALA